jgi:hypothetical protein
MNMNAPWDKEVRQVLLDAGYREVQEPGETGFVLSYSSKLAAERPSAAQIIVTLDLDVPVPDRRAVFAGYASALIMAGLHVDYRGHYLNVQGRPKGH